MQPIIDDLICSTNWITFIQREVSSNTGLPPEQEKSQTSNLTPHIEDPEKEGQMKSKVNRGKEIE